jgi:hypothetical protein
MTVTWNLLKRFHSSEVNVIGSEPCQVVGFCRRLT